MKRQRIMIIRDAELRDARGIAEAHVRSWQAAYATIVPDEDLAQLSVDQREQFWAGARRRLRSNPGCRAVRHLFASGVLETFYRFSRDFLCKLFAVNCFELEDPGSVFDLIKVV